MGFTKVQIIYLFFVCILGGLTNHYVINLSRVEGLSMAPSIAENSFVISILKPTLNLFKRPFLFGHIYILQPASYKEKLIKRLVAGPKDVVWIDNGVIFVNGENKTAQFQIPEIKKDAPLTCKYFAKYQLPEEKYFFIGDNLCDALDSRKLGGISSNEIIGEVVYQF